MKNKKLFAILTLVCFMFTLMPVAAFAAGDDLDGSQSWLVRNTGFDGVLTDTTKTSEYTIHFDTVAGNDIEGFVADGGTYTKDSGKRVFIWAEENGAVSPALNAPVVTDNWVTATSVQEATNLDNVYAMDIIEEGATVKLSFARPGTYTIKIGYGLTTADALSEIDQFGYVDSSVVVYGPAKNPENYKMTVANYGPDAENKFTAYVTDLTPNNITKQLTLTFEDTKGTVVTTDDTLLVGRTVKAQSDSANLAVNPVTAETNPLGQVKLNISAAREGVYTIYVTVDGQLFTIGVNCTNTAAAYIETVEEPEHKVALFEDGDNLVVFKVTDINGNAVRDLFTTNPDDRNPGSKGVTNTNPQARQQYLQFIEKPANSTLVNADLTLAAVDANAGEYGLQIADILDAEGVYTVRAILDNGAVATASFEVKAFETPVKVVIDAPATVELGTGFGIGLTYLDANDVEKDATDADLAATGYAIYSFDDTKVNTAADVIKVKTDEKYAGSVITLTAVSEMYDLVAVEEVKVAAEAVAIEFEDDTLEVNVNNKVEWNVVDAEGNDVTLSNTKTVNVKYVVLDKPEDAKVSVYDLTPEGAAFTGSGEMALTSNKVGNVTVQVVAQVQFGAPAATLAGNTAADVLATQQTKYYTGTEIFAVGTEDKGDVVVMSIGSNEIVKNDEVATMIAAPIVENNRTFVPFRALAEAFGAEVAWDEATQAVTAELNGVTVVMTIGSNTYTINGEEAAMDVAPFINSSSTMVPVRFVAQAFGIKVIPTYDENGATADILFNL